MLYHLLGQIRLYLEGETSVHDLADWLTENISEILDSGDHAAGTLVNELDADLVWLQEQLITIDEFKYRMQCLAQTYDKNAFSSNGSSFFVWGSGQYTNMPLYSNGTIRTGVAYSPPFKIKVEVLADSSIFYDTSLSEERELIVAG